LNIKLTVFFEEPFWVGIFERYYSGEYAVLKVVFGSEPTNNEIYHYILSKYNTLDFSEPIARPSEMRTEVSPKRLQRKIKKEVAGASVGTKAQEAIKLQAKSSKHQRQIFNKEAKQDQEILKFQKRQEKKKKKHRGH